ncbi:MAG: hypothetical protein E6J66_04840 [Deltaproteobacteria bacterium]|nr:MAG: hypothetical protein E6J66_04840 [Deltaproteobacteria bacterium]
MRELKSRTEVALGCVLLFAAYFVTALLGLRLDAVAGFATLVWPPTGIALAALWLFGFRLWPGVFAGALCVNLVAGAPLPAALGIALGNTLEAIAGVWLLGLVRFQTQLDRVDDVVALIVGPAICSTALSASIGVTSLRLAGTVSSSATVPALRAWWIGDMVGDLVVAPLLFVFLGRQPLRWRRWMRAEVLLLACALAALGLLVFGKVFGGSISLSRHPYMLFPLLAWAALRFGHYGAVTSVFLVCGIAVTGTAMGYGPFARPVLADSLLDLQAFMGVAAGTALVLGAAIAERNRAVAARDEFLSTASHELRTPFTALSLQVQGLIRRLRRSEAIPSREEMLVDLELRLEGKVTGHWDPLRLDQVIDNLISNAAKYGAGKPVEVWLSDRGERVVLGIRDHGIGIDPADQSRVFGQFERAVSPRRFGGFGLGLWITRRVVEAHGGTISLSSELGRGSTFTVELPR